MAVALPRLASRVLSLSPFGNQQRFAKNYELWLKERMLRNSFMAPSRARFLFWGSEQSKCSLPRGTRTRAALAHTFLNEEGTTAVICVYRCACLPFFKKSSVSSYSYSSSNLMFLMMCMYMCIQSAFYTLLVCVRSVIQAECVPCIWNISIPIFLPSFSSKKLKMKVLRNT